MGSKNAIRVAMSVQTFCFMCLFGILSLYLKVAIVR